MKNPVNRPFMFNAIATIFSGLFITFSRMTLSLFIAEEMPNGEYTLVFFPSVVLFSEEWQELCPVGIISCLVYSCGFLAYCIRAIWIAPRTAYDPAFIKQYAFLLNDFRAGCFWWLLVPLFCGLIVNLVQASSTKPLDVLYLQSVVIGLHMFLLLYIKPFKNRTNNLLEFLLKSALMLMNLLATSFVASSSIDDSSTEVYEWILLITLSAAGIAALLAAGTWAFSQVFGIFHFQSSKGAAAEMVFRYRDVVMESCLQSQDEFMRLASALTDQEVKTLDSACGMLVGKLLRKQYSSRLLKQQIIQGPCEIWDGKACTKTVLSATFDGALFQNIAEWQKMRINLFTLSEDLHSGNADLSKILDKAMCLTAEEEEARNQKKFTDIQAYQKRIRRRWLKESISKQAFKEAVSNFTSLDNDALDGVFQMVDDGTGTTNCREVC